MADEESFQAAAERIYHDWDKALSEDDVEALLALYAPMSSSRARQCRRRWAPTPACAADSTNCDP
jgi:hypothetical protein